MNTAVHPQEGREILAGPDAPPRALCPGCGGIVVLRRRRQGGGRKVTFTYFWRHEDNQNLGCKMRQNSRVLFLPP